MQFVRDALWNDIGDDGTGAGGGSVFNPCAVVEVIPEPVCGLVFSTDFDSGAPAEFSGIVVAEGVERFSEYGSDSQETFFGTSVRSRRERLRSHWSIDNVMVLVSSTGVPPLIELVRLDADTF